MRAALVDGSFDADANAVHGSRVEAEAAGRGSPLNRAERITEVAGFVLCRMTTAEAVA
jgi:hypothetical protein